MGHARDPTRPNGNYARHTQEIVAMHLAALQSADDCGILLADDVGMTMMMTGELTQGRPAVQALLTYLHHHAFAAPPRVTTLVAAGAHAMAEARFCGRHVGEFAGIRATGRTVHVPYVAAYEVRHTVIATIRLYLPFDAVIRQLREP